MAIGRNPKAHASQTWGFLAATAGKTSSVNSLTEDDSVVLKVDAAA